MHSRPVRLFEVYKLLPETARAEVFANTFYMPPTPSAEHQEMLFDVGFAIYSVIKKNALGKCYPAPLSVYLNKETVLEPDIIFIKTERLGIIQRGKVKGAPDLVFELLLPSNRSHDLIKKFELYQQFGVPEYIIINSLSKEVIHYILQENIYQQIPSQEGTFHSQVLQAIFSF